MHGLVGYFFREEVVVGEAEEDDALHVLVACAAAHLAVKCFGHVALQAFVKGLCFGHLHLHNVLGSLLVLAQHIHNVLRQLGFWLTHLGVRKAMSFCGLRWWCMGVGLVYVAIAAVNVCTGGL